MNKHETRNAQDFKPETFNMKLIEHFSLSEFTKSSTAMKHGIKNTPPQEAVDNLKALCQSCLEPLREALGLPVVITSGYRTKALNSMLAHSSERSQHMLGQAADFYVGQSPVSGSRFQVSDGASKVLGDLNLETGDSPMKLETPRQRLIRAFRLIILDENIDYDQLILYPSFIHVSYVSRERNRRTILLGMRNGKLGYGKCSVQNALKIE